MPDKLNILRQTKMAMDKVVDEQYRRKLIASIGKDMVDVLVPALEKIARESRFNREELKDILENITIAPPEVNVTSPEINVSTPEVNVPEIKVPEIKLPDIKLPPIKVPKPSVTVNVPPIKIPKIEIPKFDLPNDIEVSLKKEFDYKNPMPVILMDDKGNPYLAISGGGSGAKVIQDILTAGGQSVMDETNKAARVNVVAGSTSGTQYNDGATPDQSGGTGTLEMIFDGSSARSWRGTSYGVGQAILTGFDGSLIGITSNALDINIKSGSIANTGFNITGQDENSGPVSSSTLRVVQALDVGTSTNVIQYGGTNVAVGTEDGAGVMRVYQVQNVSNSVDVRSLAGTAISVNKGTADAGTQRFVVGTDATTMVVGNINSFSADDETPPVKIGGIARTTNPTKASDGNRVSQSFDAVGRSLIRPVQVRGLVQTAYVSISTGTETTLLAGIANTFLDLVYVMATNSSDAAVTVDLRSATLAGIQTSIRIPANGTAGVSLAVPIPQDVAADTWTADLPDITGTTVTLSALFSKEI